MPREVRQVRDALESEFGGLIDMSDENGPPDKVEQHFLSRALAALVTQHLLGSDRNAAVDALVDGRDDCGIDAIAVADSGTRIWLIQSKWSGKGKAGFGVAEVLKFREGLKFIDERRFDRLNVKVQERADLISSAWGNPAVGVTAVVAVMGDSLHPDVVRRLEDLAEEFNHFSDFLDYKVIDARDIWQIVRDNLAPPAVEVVAKLDQWMHLVEPFEAYQGRLSASDVADWYAQHGDRLFEQNIRKSLGLTRVNQELVDTLITSPADFWYYNNGITVLCDSTERYQASRATYSPIDLTLKGASVVNGAQTVAAIHEATQRDAAQVGQAYVSVKIVTTRNTPGNFGGMVTRATNTQNHVEPRDFVALDPVQWSIREDFALTLHKEYVYKRGEFDPDPDAGCSVTHAAVALACANGNPDLAVRAKTNRDTLWEQGSAGAYDVLFHRTTPTAPQIWRSFRVFRQVQATLAAGGEERGGRAGAIAAQGDYLIAHIVFQQLDLRKIDDLDYDWNIELQRVPELTAAALNWLIVRVDEEFGATSLVKSTFANPGRCRTLVQRVVSDLATGQAAPDLPPGYFPTPPERRLRRQNAVHSIVDAGWIREGTTLTFKARVSRERAWVDPWLAEDPKRAQATWVNHRSRPLLWAYDGQRYSPTGLVTKIWNLSGWAGQPVAVQGTAQWYVPGEGSLADIAKAIQEEYESPDDTDQSATGSGVAEPEPLSL